MFAPMKEFVVAKTPTNLLIECKPTTPDVKVTLTMVRIWLIKLYEFLEHKIQNKYKRGNKVHVLTVVEKVCAAVKI